MAEGKSESNQSFIRSIINFLQGVAFILCLFAIIFAIYFIILYHGRQQPDTNYAIVFDAGSSHTEMFVYYWPADKSDGLGTTSSVNQYFTCPLKAVTINSSETSKLKAISDFDQNLSSLKDYFRPCLTEAILKIPAERHKFSPIFLGATAGMRLVRLNNIAKSEQILETIREIFSNSPFQFVLARQVRILTGIEEAIDGWITTNILLEKFKHRHAKRNNISKQTGVKQEFDSNMVGVLDLGGASTQITFTYTQTRNDEPVPQEFTANISLFNTTYTPYAHSYLCWGKQEAFNRHRARLFNTEIIKNQTKLRNLTPIYISDPCLANGTNDIVLLNHIFRSPCTENERRKLEIPLDALNITFVGAGNSKRCSKVLTNLFHEKKNDRTVNCKHKKEYCTFDNTFQPKIPSNIEFIGLSGYYYVFNNLAFGMNGFYKPEAGRYELRDFPREQILQRLVNVCETHYSTLYQQEKMDPDSERHKRYLCFDALYIWILLEQAIGFQNDTVRRLTVANTLPTGKVGWTLGYMINQTNYIPAQFREPVLTRRTYISWLTTSCVIGFISFVFLLITCYNYCKKNSRNLTNTKNNYRRSNDQELA